MTKLYVSKKANFRHSIVTFQVKLGPRQPAPFSVNLSFDPLKRKNFKRRFKVVIGSERVSMDTSFYGPAVERAVSTTPLDHKSSSEFTLY